MHQYFDGIETPDGIPVVALRIGKIFEHDEEVCPGEKRRKVEVIVECKDERTAVVVGTHLKPGALRVSKTELMTSVYVQNATTFERCITHKYGVTKSLWAHIEK